MTGDVEERTDFVNALARGLDVLRAFGPNASVLTLSEVAQRTGLTRGTTRRLLLTLTALGYVQVDRRHFRLAPKVIDLAYAYLSTTDMWNVIQPVIERVAAQVEESVSVAVLDGADVVYVAHVPTRRILSINVGVGTRLPAYASSMGRVHLAALSPRELDAFFARADLKPITRRTVTEEAKLRAILSEVAQQGYALVDQELEDGLRAIAVPVRNASGAVVGALASSSHSNRVSCAEMRRRILPVLIEAAEETRTALKVSGKALHRAIDGSTGLSGRSS